MVHIYLSKSTQVRFICSVDHISRNRDFPKRISKLFTCPHRATLRTLNLCYICSVLGQYYVIFLSTYSLIPQVGPQYPTDSLCGKESYDVDKTYIIKNIMGDTTYLVYPVTRTVMSGCLNSSWCSDE